jgi:hypothetical protein
MNSLTTESKRDRTFWRGMYLIAFVIGVVIPVAGIIAAGAVSGQTGWRRIDTLVPDAEARQRADVNWRHDYIAGEFSYRAYESRFAEGPLLLLCLTWSGATLIGMAGIASGAWIVMATGEKLGIDQHAGFLRGMFLLAFAVGGVVPVAAVIAAGAITSEAPTDLSELGITLLVVMWCGMIAVCLTGIFAAAWLVKTGAGKLRPLAATNVQTPVNAGTFMGEATLPH